MKKYQASFSDVYTDVPNIRTSIIYADDIESACIKCNDERKADECAEIHNADLVDESAFIYSDGSFDAYDYLSEPLDAIMHIFKHYSAAMSIRDDAAADFFGDQLRDTIDYVGDRYELSRDDIRKLMHRRLFGRC